MTRKFILKKYQVYYVRFNVLRLVTLIALTNMLNSPVRLDLAWRVYSFLQFFYRGESVLLDPCKKS
jgi:hypothetical protein